MAAPWKGKALVHTGSMFADNSIVAKSAQKWQNNIRHMDLIHFCDDTSLVYIRNQLECHENVWKKAKKHWFTS